MVILRSLMNNIYMYPYSDDFEMKCNALIDCKIYGSDNAVTQLFVTSNKFMPHKAVWSKHNDIHMYFKLICILNNKKIRTLLWSLSSRWKLPIGASCIFLRKWQK